jgi:hypothetical protein
MLPPIRYPLPTMLALVIASLLAWKGAEWSREWRSEMAGRLKLAVEGPPVPSSPRPQVVAGPITKRALLLYDEIPATARPNGTRVETIDRRMFVDVYDTWPSPGPVSHVRVGNRKPIGWVKESDVLGWNTRLVVRAPEGRLKLGDSPEGVPGQAVEVGRLPLPVLAWADRAVEVAVWDQARPWSTVARRGWVRSSDLPPEAWGVWISQVELPILLGLANLGDTPELVRLRAVLGRLADNRTWTIADLEAARPALPPVVFDRGPDPQRAAGRLAEANARPSSDAAWSGLSFRFLPLSDLP